MRKMFLWCYNRLKKIDIFNKKVFTILYSSAFVCMAVISVAQIGLRSTATRQYFTRMDSYEGAYFEVSAPVYTEEEKSIVISASGESFEDAAVLLNGEKYCDLTAGENVIKIKNTSVIEIYSPVSSVEVTLSEKSDGVIQYTAENTVHAGGGIKLFGRFGIK